MKGFVADLTAAPQIRDRFAGRRYRAAPQLVGRKARWRTPVRILVGLSQDGRVFPPKRIGSRRSVAVDRGKGSP